MNCFVCLTSDCVPLTGKLIPYRTGRYFSYRSLNRYKNMLVSHRFKYRTIPAVPAKIGHSGLKLKFGRYKKKKKTILITCTVILQPQTRRRSPTTSCCCHCFFFTSVPASSSPCPSINVLSSLYTFPVLSTSDSLINVNE